MPAVSSNHRRGRDLGLFFGVFLLVLVLHLLFLHFYRGPSFKEQQGAPSLPDVSVMPLPGVTLAFEPERKPDLTPANLLDPSFLMLPHSLSYRGVPLMAETRLQISSVEAMAPPDNAFVSGLSPTAVPPPPALEELASSFLVKEPLSALLQPAASPVSPAPPPPVEKSSIRIADGLEGRVLLSEVELPAPAAESPLSPTVLRAGVLPDGRIRFLLLEKSSGSQEADSIALRAIAPASLSESAPGSPEELVWGRMIVDWGLSSLSSRPPVSNNASQGPTP